MPGNSRFILSISSRGHEPCSSEFSKKRVTLKEVVLHAAVDIVDRIAEGGPVELVDGPRFFRRFQPSLRLPSPHFQLGERVHILRELFDEPDVILSLSHRAPSRSR
jgi:hypothetical protein